MRGLILSFALLALATTSLACYANPQPPGLTPIPTLAPAALPKLVSALPAAATPSGTGTPARPGDPVAGAAIFAKNCVVCHGEQGIGGDAPALRHSTYIQSSGDDAIFNTIAHGRKAQGMPAWLDTGKLTADQIDDLVAYLRTLQP